MDTWTASSQCINILSRILKGSLNPDDVVVSYFCCMSNITDNRLCSQALQCCNAMILHNTAVIDTNGQ
jgi:hypothetical protein